MLQIGLNPTCRNNYRSLRT